MSKKPTGKKAAKKKAAKGGAAKGGTARKGSGTAKKGDSKKGGNGSGSKIEKFARPKSSAAAKPTTPQERASTGKRSSVKPEEFAGSEQGTAAKPPGTAAEPPAITRPAPGAGTSGYVGGKTLDPEKITARQRAMERGEEPPDKFAADESAGAPEAPQPPSRTSGGPTVENALRSELEQACKETQERDAEIAALKARVEEVEEERNGFKNQVGVVYAHLPGSKAVSLEEFDKIKKAEKKYREKGNTLVVAELQTMNITTATQQWTKLDNELGSLLRQRDEIRARNVEIKKRNKEARKSNPRAEQELLEKEPEIPADLFTRHKRLKEQIEKSSKSLVYPAALLGKGFRAVHDDNIPMEYFLVGEIEGRRAQKAVIAWGLKKRFPGMKVEEGNAYPTSQEMVEMGNLFATVDRENAELQDSNKQLIEIHSSQQEQIEQDLELINAQKTEMDGLRNELKGAREQRDSLEKGSEEQRDSLEKRLEEQRESFEAERKEIDSTARGETVTQYVAELQTLRDRIEEVEKERDEARRKKASKKKEFDADAERIKGYESKLSEKGDELREKDEEIRERTEEIEKLKRNLGQEGEKSKRLGKESETRREEIEKLRKAKEAVEARNAGFFDQAKEFKEKKDKEKEQAVRDAREEAEEETRNRLIGLFADGNHPCFVPGDLLIDAAEKSKALGAEFEDLLTEAEKGTHDTYTTLENAEKDKAAAVAKAIEETREDTRREITDALTSRKRPCFVSRFLFDDLEVKYEKRGEDLEALKSRCEELESRLADSEYLAGAFPGMSDDDVWALLGSAGIKPDGDGNVGKGDVDKAKQIAEGSLTGDAFNTTYDVSPDERDELVRKGLVIVIQGGDEPKYHTENPDALKRILELEKEVQVTKDTAATTLASLTAKYEKRGEDLEALKSRCEELESRLADSEYLAGAFPGMSDDDVWALLGSAGIKPEGDGNVDKSDVDRARQIAEGSLTADDFAKAYDISHDKIRKLVREGLVIVLDGYDEPMYYTESPPSLKRIVRLEKALVEAVKQSTEDKATYKKETASLRTQHEQELAREAAARKAAEGQLALEKRLSAEREKARAVEDSETLYMEAQWLRESSQYEEALSVLQEVDESGSFGRKDLLYCEVGTVYFFMGNFGKAKEMYEAMLQMEPSDEARKVAMHNLGYIYEKAGDKEKAAKYPALKPSEEPAIVIHKMPKHEEKPKDSAEDQAETAPEPEPETDSTVLENAVDDGQMITVA